MIAILAWRWIALSFMRYSYEIFLDNPDSSIPVTNILINPFEESWWDICVAP